MNYTKTVRTCTLPDNVDLCVGSLPVGCDLPLASALLLSLCTAVPLLWENTFTFNKKHIWTKLMNWAYWTFFRWNWLSDILQGLQTRPSTKTLMWALDLGWKLYYTSVSHWQRSNGLLWSENSYKVVVLGANHQKNKHRMQSEQTHSYSALSRMTQACFCTVLSLDVFCVIVLSKFGCQGIQKNLTALARGISESAYLTLNNTVTHMKIRKFGKIGRSRVKTTWTAFF